MEQPAEGTALLPDDVLADVLNRLAPRDLAMARGVCREWCAVIDGRRLLRADLLPLLLGGIFIHFNSHRFSEYFYEPSTSPTISTMADYVHHSASDYWRYVEGHCNGLVLLHGNYVVNPATRWWTQVPLPSQIPEKILMFNYHNYLVFDSILSSHYEVFCIRQFYGGDTVKDHGLMEGSEWPPSPFILQVFSSRTSGWEERLYVRDGEAAATVPNTRECMIRDSAVYYRRALYVHCQNNVVLRISISDSKYRAIQPPVVSIKKVLYLGQSKDGVYFASLGWIDNLLRIWILDESYGLAKWVLKYCTDFECFQREISSLSPTGAWVLQDVNYNYYRNHLSNEKDEAQIDSDDTDEEPVYGGQVSILGFHPFEEVLFLRTSLSRGVAYHLNSSKVQDLGYLYPTKYDYFEYVGEEIEEYFPYTPCWSGTRNYRCESS